MTTAPSSEDEEVIDVAAVKDVEVLRLRPPVAEGRLLPLGTFFGAQASIILVVRRPG